MTAPDSKDCEWVRYFSPRLPGRAHDGEVCVSPRNPRWLVGITAASNRNEDRYCGPEGKLFSPKQEGK